jgi:hypothetical protein
MKLEDDATPESAEPTHSAPAGTETPGDPTMKKCSDCAEDVRAEARKCRFCGFIFPDPQAAETEQERVQSAGTGVPWGVVALITLAMALLVFVFIAANPSGPSGGKYDVPPESAETVLQRQRKLCENEKYLADRRKLSDFTRQDLDAIQACKQLGLY